MKPETRMITLDTGPVRIEQSAWPFLTGPSGSCGANWPAGAKRPAVQLKVRRHYESGDLIVYGTYRLAAGDDRRRFEGGIVVRAGVRLSASDVKHTEDLAFAFGETVDSLRRQADGRSACRPRWQALLEDAVRSLPRVEDLAEAS